MNNWTLCVSPEHLFAGDQQLNMFDKVIKGRQNKGETHGGHKLTEAEVIYIRDYDYKRGDKKRLAAEFGITQATVSDIIYGRSWSHVQAARLS